MFEDIDQSQEIKEFMKTYIQKPNGFLLITGKNGTGKSYAAQAIYDNFPINDSDYKMFVNQSTLNLKWQKQISEWGETLYLLNQILLTDLLVLDDIGTRIPTEAFMDFLYAIVDHRYEHRRGKSTIITTNLNSKDMREKFGDAFVSRSASGKVFRFEGSDRRIQEF